MLDVPDVRADSRLAVPRLPAWHVPRPRLLMALDHAMEVPLVLISACPGAGKTVLLTEWARRGRYPVARLCPATDDNAPRRFRNLLAAATDVPFRRNVPSGRTTPVVPAQASAVDFVNSLLGKLPDNGPPLILVIDDAHVLTNPHICDLLDRLVVGDCPRLRVVLAARSDPPLPLHRYRLAGQLRELRTADLAMTPAETRQLLDAHQVTLPEPALSTLISRTEGWVGGLRLAAMRMQGAAISNRAATPARLVDEPGFGHGSVGEYLLAEAFEHQPERLRRLLVETSFLDELTGPLAEAVTGIDGCAEMLRELARSNSFVIALDNSGTRFRYHRLFAEVLRQRQDEKTLPELAARAAAWFEQNGDPEHALYWAAKAGNRQRAIRALVHGGLSAAFAQRHPLPSAELSELLLASTGHAAGPGVPTRPDTPLAMAALCAITGDVGTAARELAKTRVTSTAQSPGDPAVLHTAAVVEFMLGMRSGDAEAVDAAALRLTGGSLQNPARRQVRAAVLLAQASTHFWHGDHGDVDVLLGQALAAAQQDGLTAIAADTLAMIACVDSYRGRTRHADAAALRARCLLRQEPGLAVPPALRLAVVIRACAEADFTRASRALGRAFTPDEVGADPALGAALDLWHASILGLSGNLTEAQAVLAQDAEDAPCPRFPLIEIHRDIVLGEIDTSLGRPLSAVKRLERHHEGKLAALVATSCARAHLALHDQKTAQDYTRRVLSAASAQLSRLVLVDAMLLEARIAHISGNLGRALEMITNALDVAGDELVLPFGAAKASLAGLLARHPAIADRWPALPSPGDTAATGDQCAQRRSRPVLLTQREQAIARYLATSMSVAEIADEMYLSVNTVKTHLAGIYRKLGAGKRRQALLRARELELLLAVLGPACRRRGRRPRPIRNFIRFG